MVKECMIFDDRSNRHFRQIYNCILYFIMTYVSIPIRGIIRFFYLFDVHLLTNSLQLKVLIDLNGYLKK